MVECQQVKIIVKGRVQGVGYRAFVEKEANSLGLKGYCRNLPDGCVEVAIEGEKEKLDQLITRLWKGPFLARVTDIQVDQNQNKSTFSDFSIRF